ncbi:MAG: class I SAM-dependent methyltransferase [Thermoleophilaceae bacterium]|nr:class I SAM-dependent methyltransferase [Thermoleophilaceae bacterium]
MRSRSGRDALVTAPAIDEAVAWHDVECAGYAADLALWRELAASAGGAVLEIGAGTGRVALDLAGRGHEVSALDSDPALVDELGSRARGRGLRVRVHRGDARSFALGRRFALIVAPMQVVQLLGGDAGRRSALGAARRHLDAGGQLALALADPLEGLAANAVLPPLPDVRELDGWVYSSRPVALRREQGAIAIDRIRECVSPTGELRASAVTVRLDVVDADGLARLATETGFHQQERRPVPATDAYVGSEVLVLEAA